MSDALAVPPPPPRRSRLGYIDWVRGVAVLLMIQSHAIEAWLQPEVRSARFFRTSQFLAGTPAPLFLFLAGLSMVLLLSRLTERGATHGAVVREGLWRGAQVIGYAILFRLLVFAAGGFYDVRNLLRVDILNCIGLAMLFCAVLVFPLRGWTARFGAAVLLTLAFVLVAPLAWYSVPADALPVPLHRYLSGRDPLAFFPLFPWAGFCAAGVVVGLIFVRGLARQREGWTLLGLAVAGAALVGLGFLLDRAPPVYAHQDFWHTSPSFFWMRLGFMLLLLGVAYVWHLLPPARWPSAIRQMGSTSLLIYMVHIELAYGRFGPTWAHRKLTEGEALLATALLTLAMLGLSLARTHGARLLVRPALASIRQRTSAD